MIVDHYAGAGRRWATGAALVYGPIARLLVTLSPPSPAGRVVVDAGAGTGIVSTELAALGARVVALDMSQHMLAWDAGTRPPAAVADVRALPLADGAVDDSVAAFVLNHLVDPAPGFDELVRVTRPGGAVLVGVFATTGDSEVRDRVDASARLDGWEAPDWYLTMKAEAVPVLGTADRMAQAATVAGLAVVAAEERAVDVGVTSPEQLVDYRFGQAQFTTWLDGIGPARAAAARRRAVEAARPFMQPYRPQVVLLAALRRPG